MIKSQIIEESEEETDVAKSLSRENYSANDIFGGCIHRTHTINRKSCFVEFSFS